MRLTAVISREEIVALIRSLMPMRIAIDERRGRAVILGRPDVELVAGRGLRARGDARIAWDVAGVPIPVTVQAWQVILVPRVVPRGRSHWLTFEPVLEALDLKRVPGFVDDKILAAAREGILRNRDRLAWDFARAFTKRWPMPRRIGGQLDLVAGDGAVTVTAAELRLEIHLEARIAERTPVSERVPRSTRHVAVATR